LGIVDEDIGNVLLSSGVDNDPVYGKVNLTTHVSGALLVANGGTGHASYAIGDITYANSATTLSKLANVATGNVLLSGGVGAAPSYGKAGLTTHVDGILPAANGGTGQASYTIGDITFASGATALSKLADVATGNVLLSGGVGVAPAYGKVGLTTHVDGTLPVANGGTGQASYTIGDIVYASGSTTLSKLSDVATGHVLISGGVGVSPTYVKVGLTTHVDGTLAVGNGGTGQTSYVIGDIIYANSSTTLAKLSDVATGNVLLSGGSGVAPTYGKVNLATHVSGTLPVAYGGTGVTSSTGSGANVLATSPTLIAPILGTPAAGSVLTNCTGLPLNSGVTETLPIANGGTGVTQSAYGECYISSLAATTITTTGVFVKVAGSTTAGSLSNFTQPVSNRLTYTGTATRKFLVNASLSFHGTNGNDYKFAFYKNGSSILSSSIISTTATGAGSLAHVSCQCFIELATNEFIEMFVANADAANSATVDFMNMTTVALI
jgi:hypothetical protein